MNKDVSRPPDFFVTTLGVFHKCGCPVDGDWKCPKCHLAVRRDIDRVNKALDEAWERNRLRPEY